MVKALYGEDAQEMILKNWVFSRGLKVNMMGVSPQKNYFNVKESKF